MINSIPVLMYHGIDDQLKPEKVYDQGEYIYIISKENFRSQLKYLKNNGFRSFYHRELALMDVWPEKAIVITFDDGHESNYNIALPMLQEFGFKAEFFITSNWINKRQYMTPDQIKGLYNAGMAIGSHGVTHKFLDELNEAEVEKELAESQNTLSEIIGTLITSFSAPGGRLHRSTVSIAQKYDYREVFTSQAGVLVKKQSHYNIPRFPIMQSTSVDKFIKIVNKDSKMLLTLQLKNLFYLRCKKSLGNKNYEAVRKILLDTLAKFR